MLFLSAVSLVTGNTYQRPPGENEDIAVVPLAMPVTVGPGTAGALLVLGTDVNRNFGGDVRSQAVAVGALLAAVLSVGAMLYLAARADRFLPPRIMSVLTKLTGLILASLAAELIFTGIRNFLR
jgi:multiple antibiotic resistance protein